MKIFNWVQRKLNHNLLKDGLARNVKKTESRAIDANTKALLEQVAFIDVLEGWRDGILTIGTFGFDPLQPFDHTNEYCISESEDEEEEQVNNQKDSLNISDDHDDNIFHEDDEEVNPLMSETFTHNFEDFKSNADGGHDDAILTVDGVPLTPTVSYPNEVIDDISATTTDEAKKKRTTLAELFSEDSEDIKKKENPEGFESKWGEKQCVRTKNGFAIAKKFIPHLKEDSRPVKKLNQMMRRMLKRRIHPEIEGDKASKSDTQNKTTLLELLAKKHESTDSVSLLHIPDVTV